MNTINFTPKLLANLKEKYKLAKETGADVFIFEGHELLTAYAKYLIEYLDGKLKPPTKLTN